MKKYNDPKINIELFLTEDVITTSGEPVESSTSLARKVSFNKLSDMESAMETLTN